MTAYRLRPIGRVESSLTDQTVAPRQPDEGAPDAWLDRADRDTLTVRPRGDTTRPLTGVFATRAPDRRNPIGLHTVHILAIAGTRVHVRNLEALDSTPILDVKPLLTPDR